MRRFEQKQILELLNTIKETNSMLEKLYVSGNQQAFQDILASVQNGAVTIGTRLEELTTEEDVIHLLEEYCELVWETSQIETKKQLTEMVTMLNAQMELITVRVQELPIRLEVVFLPYKASMWDCMETVWKAAVEDPDCDVYVIPIPYFDRKQDGSIGQVHYEANLMPQNVPMVSFQEYDIEARRPDIIYIHNPFDEYNRVTSVHPDFYCSKLKNYTDMLVYIPYFLLNEHLSESHRLLPAYVHANKIVLQGEKMIEDIDESIPREKFLIAGSPKAERMIWMETHKEELPVPQAWKKLIENKKVVFYNVSITGLLNDREEALDKMEEVFGLMEQHPELILLFRPHPLIEPTLESMCPELLERYESLVARVKGMKNAIYDTTPDVGMSVAISDVYIGERTSSVVDMFKSVKKPIFFLTTEKYYQPTRDELLSESTMDACKVGDDIWFVTQPLQMLCKYSLTDKKIECVAALPEIPNVGGPKYVSIVNYGDKLILVPYHADALCIYDMRTKSFRKDYFREEYVDSCFGRAIVHGHYVFLTPMDYPAIVRYDVLTGEYTYYEECIREVREQIENVDEKHPFVWGVASYKEELYIASIVSNIIITFNMETAEYSISRIGKESNTYRGMVADEMYCWMLLNDSPTIVRWNRLTGEVKEYSNFPDGFEAGDVPFKNILDMGEVLYLLPAHANHSCILNKASEEIVYADWKLPHQEDTFKSEFYKASRIHYDFAKKMSEIEIMASAMYDKSLVILNTKDMSCDKIPIRLENKLEMEIKRFNPNRRLVTERESLPLNKYLEYVSEDLVGDKLRRGIARRELVAEDSTGVIIHEEIKKIL